MIRTQTCITETQASTPIKINQIKIHVITIQMYASDIISKIVTITISKAYHLECKGGIDFQFYRSVLSFSTCKNK